MLVSEVSQSRRRADLTILHIDDAHRLRSCAGLSAREVLRALRMQEGKAFVACKAEAAPVRTVGKDHAVLPRLARLPLRVLCIPECYAPILHEAVRIMSKMPSVHELTEPGRERLFTLQGELTVRVRSSGTCRSTPLCPESW